MKSVKIPINDEGRTRIHEYQKDSGLQDKEAAEYAGLNVYTYKNIIRENGSKTILVEAIERLARHYNCSRDYLTGDSSDPKTDRNGHPLTSPIEFVNESEAHDISKFLNDTENRELTRNLYFLFYVLPIEERANIINSINSVIGTLRTNSLFGKDISEDKIDRINKTLLPHNSSYIEALITLSSGDEHLSHNRYKRALKLYLKILSKYEYYLENSKDTYVLIHDTIKNILYIRDKGKIPQELASLTTELKNINPNEKFIKLPPEMLELINQYLSDSKK